MKSAAQLRFLVVVSAVQEAEFQRIQLEVRTASYAETYNKQEEVGGVHCVNECECLSDAVRREKCEMTVVHLLCAISHQCFLFAFRSVRLRLVATEVYYIQLLPTFQVILKGVDLQEEVSGLEHALRQFGSDLDRLMKDE